MSNKKIRIIRVSGGPYERSYKHSQQLGKEVMSGSLDFFRNFWSIKLAQMAPGMPYHLRCALERAIKTAVVNPSIKDWRLQYRDRAILRGYCKGLKNAIPYEELKKAFIVPDAYNYWLSWLFNQLGGTVPAAPELAAGGFGCSSMVAWGDATAAGNMIFGRNLDFLSGDKWVDNQVILIAEPGSGDIPFVSVCSAGVPVEGVTSMNAEGLVIAVHQNSSKAINRKGRSIISITNEIISKASSIYEVIDIVSRTHPIAGWTIVAASASEKHAVIIETNAKKFDITYPEPGHSWLRYGNSYLSPELKKDEFSAGYTLHEHNHARLLCMDKLLEKNAGSITVEKMAVMLGDHYDPYAKKDRPFGNTISSVHNVSSVVFEPGSQKLWVALGPAPANTTEGYAGFDIDAIRKGRDGDLGTIPGNPYFKSKNYPALREYTLAYQAHDQLDEEKVSGHLNKAHKLDPDESIYAFMLAIDYLKKGSISIALDTLNIAEQPYNTPYRRAAIYLWQGRCYDLLKNRAKARELYLKAFETAPEDSKIPAKARKGLQNPYKNSSIKGIMTEFIMGDAIDV